MANQVTVAVTSQADAIAWLNTRITAANAKKSAVTTDVSTMFMPESWDGRAMPRDGDMQMWLEFVLNQELSGIPLTSERWHIARVEAGRNIWTNASKTIEIILLQNSPTGMAAIKKPQLER